ncbi:glycosyltransferase [Candidatus Woesearchaeota archaeon]|nr:glycosyltransferase [Candidatus Woesearchaeota archaeon]
MNSITIISSLPPIKGISPYTSGYVKALSKHIKIDFLGFNKIYPSFLYPGGITDNSAILVKQNKNLKIKNVLNWYNPIQWISEAFRIKTPVVHAQWWSWPLAPLYWTILGISRLRGKKVIMTIHNVKPHEKSKLKIWLNNSVYGFANEYVVHTEQGYKDLRKIVSTKKINLIPHGLIENPLRNISVIEARKKLGLNINDKILLCFGNIRDYKGVDIALKSLAQIKDKKVKLLIAGKCWEDWSKYQKIIDKYNLSSRVILKLDFIPAFETEYIFKASDLILMPYKHFDAASGVASQIIPYKIPFIVSKTGSLPDLVFSDVCLIKPNDYVTLSKNIVKILSDKKLYSKLKKDVSSIQKKLSWDELVLKYLGDVF